MPFRIIMKELLWSSYQTNKLQNKGYFPLKSTEQAAKDGKFLRLEGLERGLAGRLWMEMVYIKYVNHIGTWPSKPNPILLKVVQWEGKQESRDSVIIQCFPEYKKIPSQFSLSCLRNRNFGCGWDFLERLNIVKKEER